MKFTDYCMKNRAAVLAAAFMVAALGIFMLNRLPVQLLPNVESPALAIQTFWRAASPAEIESEIVEPLEEVMEGLTGLKQMVNWSNPQFGWVNMEFELGTDMDRALIDVISRINRLPPLPADADPPRVLLNGGNNRGEMLIFLFTQFSEDSPLAEEDRLTFMRDEVAPILKSIDGVADVQIQAGTGEENQLQIRFDPARAAELGVNVGMISSRVGRSVDSSGGFLDVGRRSYLMNFKGRYGPDELRELILEWRDGRPIRLGDVAEISISSPPKSEVSYQNGQPAIGMRVMRKRGANVLETIDELTVKLDELNAGMLADAGVQIEKSFDPSTFIKRAIRLLGGNLLIGVALATLILYAFLRQRQATFLVAATVPICLLATIVVLGIAGRSVNIISLAGLAFATGMVMDAAIVVLENIVRLREEGKSPTVASVAGTGQVWGALLASTLTTVAIFTPILFLEGVEGQVFADLALTIAIGVAMSLIVAVTILPVAAAMSLKTLPKQTDSSRRGAAFARRVVAFTEKPARRTALTIGMIAGSLGLSIWLLPNLNYLPPVKRDAIDTFISFPAGSNVETVEKEILSVVIDRLQPYLDGEKQPAIKNYYMFTFPGASGGLLGVRAKDQDRVEELQNLLRSEILAGFPDIQAYPNRRSLFGGIGNGSGGVQLHIHSRDLDALMDMAGSAMQMVTDALPGAFVQPNPDPGAITPELQISPNDRRLAEVGLTRNDIASTLRALGDGLWLGEYFDDKKRMDMILRSDREFDPAQLASMPLATPNGGVVPLGDLVSISRSVSPASIQRVGGKRTLSLQINQPDDMTLEDMLNVLQNDVAPKVKELLPSDGTITYGGSADDLDRAVKSLSVNFLVALALLFMVLAALFKSPKDAALVVITIPLATVGGVLALNILNIFALAPLDLLTMIGFIILLGLVVNNAILLVAQTRAGEGEGLGRREAIERAITLRLRPIFMSTLTSIMGMLPLVLFPGAGSAIYRGMATTIVGGMTVSTLFTLVLLPALLRMGREKSADESLSQDQQIQPAE